MNLANLLENTAESAPRHVGLRFEGKSSTFQELNRHANRVANGLRAAGLQEGDRCTLMMQSGPEFITVYYALAKMGAVIIPVNFLYKRGELSHIFRDSGAKAFVGMEPYLQEPLKVLMDLPQLPIRIASGVKEESNFIPLERIDGSETYETFPAGDDEALAILYSSGTTGPPKGAVLTHKNLYSNAMTVADMRETGSGDVVTGVLPLFHIYGQTSVLNASIYKGLTLHLFRQFDPEDVLSLIEGGGSTILIAVPTIFSRLILASDHKGIKRSSLRFCISGGASLPIQVLQKFEKRFKTKIFEGYGLSECSPVCVENPFGGKTKLGSIGLPILGFRARIVDEANRDVQRGQVGELSSKARG